MQAFRLPNLKPADTNGEPFIAFQHYLLYNIIWYFFSRGGKNFAKSCSRTLEPEDVTVGVVVGESNNN